MTPPPPRDHGGGLDAAVARFGGARADWFDLSTGINPVPYPLPAMDKTVWTSLPDKAAQNALDTAARGFWGAPDTAGIIAANGASALIAQMPALVQGHRVSIPGPTYNEHAAAFGANGWTVLNRLQPADALVLVHPNNPDGRLWQRHEINPDAYKLVVIDESFAEVTPDQTLIDLAARPNVVVLKSFGKFWGLAGLRLGFAFASAKNLHRLDQTNGPWPVSGPALAIGTRALHDHNWATATRTRLATDAQRLDDLAKIAGYQVLGGTDLFRLYDTPDAQAAFTHLANHRVLGRIFPYSPTWLRLGLPGSDQGWAQAAKALGTAT